MPDAIFSVNLEVYLYLTQVRSIYSFYILSSYPPFTIISDNSSCVFGSIARILNIDKKVNTSTTLTKLDRYVFMTEIDTNCSAVNFEWKVSNVTSLPFSVGISHSVTVGSDSEWSDTRSLDLGIYLVEYIVHFQNFYFLDYGFMEVLPSPPVAHIAGGPEVSRKHNSLIRLNGSPSREVNLEPGNYGGMTFSWSCKRKGEQFYDVNASSYSIGCFGTGKQALEDTGKIVFLDTSPMEVNQFYDIKLTVSTAIKMSDSFVQRMHIVSGEPLYVEIK